MPEPKRNRGAWVRARLLNLAKQPQRPAAHALRAGALALSSQREEAEGFVLKGAMLMMTWFENRPTRDCDLLGDPDRVRCAGLAINLICEQLE
jgi:hypothetical protein